MTPVRADPLRAGSPDDWRTEAVDDLCDALLTLRTQAEVGAFLRDVCSLHELEVIAHRWQAARLLDQGMPYAKVAETVHGSTATDHPGRALASPRRGRLPAGTRPAGPAEVAMTPASTARSGSRCPARAACTSRRSTSPAAAGVEVDMTGRVLHSHCSQWDIEVLLARSDDIPAWTQDGAVEMAIAGRNQIAETRSQVDVLADLGFGRCSLQVAVRDSDPITLRSSSSTVAGSPPPTPRPPAGSWPSAASRPRSPPSTARSSWPPGWTPPTPSSTWCRPATRCAPTVCARSRPCSSPRRCCSPAPGWTSASARSPTSSRR